MLQIAERRLLTAGEPGDAAASPLAPAPPARSVFRRF